MLTSDDLVRGIGMLRRAGVRAVRNLNVDASRFAGPEQNAGWLRDDEQYDYAAGTSALSLDWDVLKTVVYGAQIYRPVTNIPAYVGGVARDMMKRAGIEVDRVQAGVAPLAATTLWAHPSPTVDALVRQMFLNRTTTSPNNSCGRSGPKADLEPTPAGRGRSEPFFRIWASLPAACGSSTGAGSRRAIGRPR